MTATIGTEPQHMCALRHGTDIRLARAALHKRCAKLGRRGGCAFVAELLEDPPAEIATLAIFDLLQWPHSIGRSQARGILRMHGPIGERRQIRELTPRQRAVLAEHFRGAADGWDRRNQ